MENDSPPSSRLRVLSVSGNLSGLLGYSPEHFLAGQVRLEERVHPEDAGLLVESTRSVLRGRTAVLNLRMRHADGRIRCLRGQAASAVPGPEPTPQVELRLEDARSVTEPGDAGLVANFSVLLQHSRDILYVKNRNHVYLDASRALAQLTGAASQPADCIGKTDYDLFPEDVADLSYRLERQAFAGKRRTNKVQQRQLLDGAPLWLDDRKYPISGADGEMTGILGIAPVITESMQAKAKLREREQSLREAQHIAGLGSYEFDLRTRLWRGSEELHRILGTGPDCDHTLDGLWSVIHPEDRPILAERLEGYFRGERTEFDREYRVVRQDDGAIRWVHTRGRLEYDAAGQPVLLRGTLQDITAQKQSECELRESRELLRLFIEHAPAALAMYDRNLRYVAASRRWMEIHQLQGQSILGRSAYEVLPHIPEEWRREHQQVLQGVAVPAAECALVLPDGKSHWYRRELRPWHQGDGSIGGVVVLSEEITSQREAEERLRLAGTVFTHAAEGILITDAEGRILEVNDAFTRITGYTREEALGGNPRFLQSGIHSREFYQNLWNSLEKSGHWKGEIWNRNKKGEIYAQEMTINAIRDAQGKASQYVALFSDVTRLKEQERQLEHMAHYDGLTGLPNRALLVDRLRQGMAQAHRRNQMVALAILDLDDFKGINARYGQALGDRLLHELARRMRVTLRDGDTLARIGGDEFAVVLVDLDSPDQVAPVLQRLLRDAAASVRIGRLSLRVTASIGVALYPQEAHVDAEQFLRQAQQALYEAKAAGRNCYATFDPSRGLGLRGSQQELQSIRRALHQREFVLYYQPKVNMRTGAVTGAEALIRWQHPHRGLLPPAAFLPLIENDPLSVELGEWVIETALQQIEEWQASGLDLPVSVNVGALQLQQKDFPERLWRLFADHPTVSPSSLELEVLETSALQDLVQASSVLEICHSMGVSFAIDDFGTGYASLTYLKRLPAQTLKIEQSFVRDMLEDPENPTILEAILSLAHAFQRNVVAEGVETVEHGWMLLQLGCEIAQGYGIARPMPAAELPRFVQTWRPDPRWTDSPSVHAGNRTLLFACVEHRAWLGALDSYLHGRRHSPPAMDPAGCRFRAWLDGERQTGRLDLTAFAALETLHQQLHALAAEILDAHKDCQHQPGNERMGVLHGLGRDFLQQLANWN